MFLLNEEKLGKEIDWLNEELNKYKNERQQRKTKYKQKVQEMLRNQNLKIQ